MNLRVWAVMVPGQLVSGERGPVQCGTCGFLLNDRLVVDAGTVGSRLYLEEQRRIRVVLLTHLHFDHIRELPTLADNLVGEIDEPVIIAAIPEVLDGLRRHIFNGVGLSRFFPVADPPNRSSCPRAAPRTGDPVVRIRRNADSSEPCGPDGGISAA